MVLLVVLRSKKISQKIYLAENTLDKTRITIKSSHNKEKGPAQNSFYE